MNELLVVDTSTEIERHPRQPQIPSTAKLMLNVPQERFHDMVLFKYTVLAGPRRGSLKKRAQEMEKY